VAFANSSALVSYKLALAARGAGDLPTAVAALQEAVRLNPSFAQAHYVMGLCLKDRGQLRDAQKSFEKALAINAALIPAREEMAELHRLQAQTREEIEQLEALAALDPSHAERLIAVGLAYSRTGNPELAVTALGRAVEKFQQTSVLNEDEERRLIRLEYLFGLTQADLHTFDGWVAGRADAA